tara:strand:- start:161 stop:763 length:603 start_codon:yes stop_codon:yes gene_type:complete
MFTGIVEETGVITEISEGQLGVRASVVLDGTKIGDSICVSGACLTVIKIDQDGCLFDVMPETFDRTNLGLAKVKGIVNLERAMLFNGRVGGHLVQGHVDGTGKVTSTKKQGDAIVVRFQAPRNIMKYIVEKGFIAVNGASLTITEAVEDFFSVSLVRFTYENTDLGVLKIGDEVNLEVDILAKYTERLNQRETIEEFAVN